MVRALRSHRRGRGFESPCLYHNDPSADVDGFSYDNDSFPCEKRDAMKTVNIYTDGACSGNPGVGGWGTILSCEGKEKELCGAEAQTTNNRMELTAVIEGLKALKKPCKVMLYTDSQYIVNAVNLGWAVGWRQNGWRKADKKKALNVDLWEELLELLEKNDVTFEWVRGHDGHPQNERCDALAVGAWTKLKESLELE